MPDPIFDPSTPANIVSYSLPGSSIEGHAAELRTAGDTELVHNRFYIPMEAQFAQFKYFVKEAETGINSQGQHVQRQPNVDVFVKVGTQEYRIVQTLTPALPAVPGGPANFQSMTPMSLTNAVKVGSPTGETLDLRGQVGELIFRLSFGPNEPPPDLSGTTHTRIWIDDVRLGPVGTPLQAERTAPSDGTVTALNPNTVATLLAASRGQWLGIVHAPDGIAGLSLGLVGVSTDVLASASHAGEGGTGVSEGGFYSQRFYTDMGIGSAPFNQQTGAMAVGLAGDIPAADQSGRNGEAALATNGHAVETQDNPRLVQTQQASFSQAIMDKGSSIYTNIGEHGALVGEGAIGISNFDISRNLAAPSGDRTITDFEILNLEELALQPFIFLPLSLGGGGGLIDLIRVVPEHTAPALSQNKGYEDDNEFEHLSSSFGTPTLLPDRNLVNSSGSFGTGFVGLTPINWRCLTRPPLL